MRTPSAAVSFSSVKINEMMARGCTHKEVAEYLINETAVYAAVIDDNNTGVYAYYDGEYLDGSGWILPADYEPTERPWYTEALKAP